MSNRRNIRNIEETIIRKLIKSVISKKELLLEEKIVTKKYHSRKLFLKAKNIWFEKKI